VTLAGGDANTLTLSEFLDAGYALLVEAYQSAPGGHLMEALEKAAQWSEGGPESEDTAQESVERENARSLAQLDMMMRGVAK